MDLRNIEQIAERHGLTIIEDTAQAHGVAHGNTKIGASGRLTCFSFYPGKNLGAYGDSGAVACSQPRHFETLRLLRDHGSTSKYQHSIVGTNSRMDAIQAAVLSIKLRHLDRWNAQRVEHAGYLRRGLAATSITPRTMCRRRSTPPALSCLRTFPSRRASRRPTRRRCRCYTSH